MDHDAIKTAAVVAIPILIAIIGFFLRKTLTDNTDTTKEIKLVLSAFQVSLTTLDKDFVGIKKDIHTLMEGFNSLRAVREEWYSMKKDVGQVALEMKNLKSSLEDVVILKRDQQTMWRRLDELRADLLRKEQ